MNEEEIVAGLLAAGVPMASTNAIVNFRMAARRRPDLLFAPGAGILPSPT